MNLDYTTYIMLCEKLVNIFKWYIQTSSCHGELWYNNWYYNLVFAVRSFYSFVLTTFVFLKMNVTRTFEVLNGRVYIYWCKTYISSSLWRRANARNVRLCYLYRYTDLFIFRFVSLICLRSTLRLYLSIGNILNCLNFG